MTTLDQIVNPEEAIPRVSRFKRYHDFTVQDIVITTKNTRYRLAHWQTPDGRYLSGKLPNELQGRHFGPGVVGHILYQHHHCHVTQPLLLIHKMLPLNDQHRADIAKVRRQVRDLYADLKSYKLAPAEKLKPQLKKTL